MSGEETAVMIVMAVMSVPLAGIITWHRQQIEKIRASKRSENSVDATVLAELSQLKEQVLALRDTTTKFDLSFDASLDNLENRMKRVEERQLSQSYNSTEESTRMTVGR